MRIPRRTSREVYRIYSEAEYHAGADASGEWHTSQPTVTAHERPLRRLGAAGALTGALGALGGVIVFAGIGARSPHHLLAVNRTPVKGGVLLRRREADGARNRGDRMRRTARMRHAGRSASRGVRPSARRRRRRRADTARWARVAAPGVEAKPAGAMPDVAYDATRADPGEHAMRSPTRSEFGFER